MAGNANSGRRPGLDSILQDAGMSSRLTIEVIDRASEPLQDLINLMAMVRRQARETRQLVDDAVAQPSPPWDGRTERRRAHQEAAATSAPAIAA